MLSIFNSGAIHICKRYVAKRFISMAPTSMLFNNFANIIRDVLEWKENSTISLKNMLPNSITLIEQSESFGSIWQSSTMKKRRMKMNKHKRRKARKLKRMNTKLSRSL